VKGIKGVSNRYSLGVGLVFLALVIVATIHTLNGGGEQTLGLDKQPPRWPLPEFAVPAAAGNLEGDANVYQDDCESSSLPCPSGSTRVPACQITTRGAIRVCDLFDRPLVISFWFGPNSKCEQEQNVVSEVAARYRGRVNFLSLDVLDSRESVREVVRAHGWHMPVGFDRDGAVAALYRVGGCPTFAFAYPGGTLESAGYGVLNVGALSQDVEQLLKATRVAEGG
jgi:thiol-disulfide isomerase/thioredoxin